MSITEELVELVRSKPVTTQDRHLASLFLLDALASAYAGANTDVGRKLIGWATKDAMNSRSQAFLMGALAHITETDDLHKASVTHPGCVVVPSVLAGAQRINVSGSQVLDATLCGFEAMCRIGRAVGPAHYKVWHNTATCGPFGSAMALAELLNLNNSQCVYALGNAGTQSSGLWQFLNTGAMSKHLHAGRASEAGVLAAELAQQDFTGAPDILEGAQGMFVAMCPDARAAKVLQNPEGVWELAETSIKPWPSCRHTHPAIDAALELHQQLGNAIVEAVSIGSYQAALDICDRATCDNEYQAKFSLQHCVCTALLNGEVALESFSEQARQSVQDKIPLSTVALNEELNKAYPLYWGAEIGVRLSDGRELSAIRRDCKGDPELPLTESEMVAKATYLLNQSELTATQSDTLVNRVLALPTASGNVDLMPGFMAHVMKMA